MAGFADILGHQKEIEHLKRSIAQNKVGHAYIFNGERGCGKRRLADAFALSLQCENPEQAPCCTCHSCRQALSGNHPDIIYVQHESPKMIKVDEVRAQILHEIDIRPYNGRRKIFIVEDAQLMNPQAQNALLKTLEEPPAYAILLLLTTNTNIFLDTIRSRCVALNLRPVPDELVKTYLMEKVQIPDYQAEVCAAFAQGNIGKAVRLATSEDFGAIRNAAMQLVRTAGQMEISDAIEFVKQVQSFKITITDFLDMLALWYRDMVYYKATKEIDGLVFKEELKFIREMANTCSYEGAETVVQAIETARARLKANVNFDLTMELLFLVIRENVND